MKTSQQTEVAAEIQGTLSEPPLSTECCRVNLSLNGILYLVCGLTDFAAFVVVFGVSRGLAERQSEPWYLGAVGAGMSFSAGVGSILGGWLSQRFDGRPVFLLGAAGLIISAAGSGWLDAGDRFFLPAYWSLGIALGFLYPPLIGWLNQGNSGSAGGRGVSRTLILYCIAWNVGMMCGQLAAGSLFARGGYWLLVSSVAVAGINLLLAILAVTQVRPPDVLLTARVKHVVEDRPISQATAFKRLSWIANLGGMFGGSLVIHLLPDLAVTIGIPASQHGIVLAGWRSIIIVTYLLMHNVSFWQYSLKTAVASQLTGFIGLIVVGCSDSALMLLIGLALLGQLVGYNYFSGLFYSTMGTAQKKRALAAGIHEATLAGGMAIGTLAGGFAGSRISHRAPYFLASAVLLLLVGLQIAAWRKWSKSNEDAA